MILGTALAVFACAILILSWRWYREPRYQGKTTAQWFKAYRETDALQQQFQTVNTPSGVRLVRVAPLSFPKRSRAADGLRGLGTNALPYLTVQLRRREGVYERLYPRVFYKTPTGIRKLLANPPTPCDEIRRQAALAVEALGTNGAPAAPALLESLKYCGPTSEYTILQALRRFDYDRQAADELVMFMSMHGLQTRAVRVASELWLVTPTTGHCLLQILSNTNMPPATNMVSNLNRVDRSAIVHHLGYYWKYAGLVIPGLAAALRDPDRQVRLAAAGALEDFGPAATPALPALEKALQSDDSELRYHAVRAIEAMGTNARPAIPRLTQATNDSFVPVQTVSKRTLEALRRTAGE